MKTLTELLIVAVGLLLSLSLSAQTIDELKTRAANGDAEAQFNLGVFYENGYGVTKDYTEAVKWWRKAAEQGDAEAKIKLNDLGVNW